MGGRPARSVNELPPTPFDKLRTGFDRLRPNGN